LKDNTYFGGMISSGWEDKKMWGSDIEKEA
jgi:hypothetical protein